MLIRLGYDIEIQIPQPTTVVAVLNVHPSRTRDLREPDRIRIFPDSPQEQYRDVFGNICTRITASAGALRLCNSTLIEDSGLPDAAGWYAPQLDVDHLPPDTIQFLLASRYCEVDLLSQLAWNLFGATAPGWPRVQAICDYVNRSIEFGYQHARATRTAQEAFHEGRGVCRDFQHLAIAFCRALHIPARYATGYLGDIGVPYGGPMDFSAWFEVYLGDRWWAFDARNNRPRIGRILIATGRDAADVAITTSFGAAQLTRFSVVTEEVAEVAEHALMR